MLQFGLPIKLQQFVLLQLIEHLRLKLMQLNHRLLGQPKFADLHHRMHKAFDLFAKATLD